jgi:hypothetical protein
MRGPLPPLPQYAFMVWCSVQHRDNYIICDGIWNSLSVFGIVWSVYKGEESNYKVKVVLVLN